MSKTKMNGKWHPCKALGCPGEKHNIGNFGSSGIGFPASLSISMNISVSVNGLIGIPVLSRDTGLYREIPVLPMREFSRQRGVVDLQVIRQHYYLQGWRPGLNR